MKPIINVLALLIICIIMLYMLAYIILQLILPPKYKCKYYKNGKCNRIQCGKGNCISDTSNCILNI